MQIESRNVKKRVLPPETMHHQGFDRHEDKFINIGYALVLTGLNGPRSKLQHLLLNHELKPVVFFGHVQDIQWITGGNPDGHSSFGTNEIEIAEANIEKIGAPGYGQSVAAPRQTQRQPRQNRQSRNQ